MMSKSDKKNGSNVPTNFHSLYIPQVNSARKLRVISIILVQTKKLPCNDILNGPQCFTPEKSIRHCLKTEIFQSDTSVMYALNISNAGPKQDR